MLTLPIPMIVAILLVFLTLRNLIISGSSVAISCLLAACAGQSLIVALSQYYGIAAFHLVQPVTASLIPPITWLAFVQNALRPLKPKQDIWHIGMPLIVLMSLLWFPVAIDYLLFAQFVLYGFAIIIILWQSHNELANARLSAGSLPAQVWKIIGLMLITSAFSDAIITTLILTGHQGYQSIILSAFSSVTILIIGTMCLIVETTQDDAIDVNSPQKIDDTSLSDARISATDPASGQLTKADQEIAETDKNIVSQLEQMVTSQQLFLDPDLTLAKLSRKMGIPLKQLSKAINAVTHENVSRFINRFRIDHACKELENGLNITTTIYNSGFNTKSNFNREFLRLKGVTPRDWQNNIKA